VALRAAARVLARRLPGAAVLLLDLSWYQATDRAAPPALTAVYDTGGSALWHAHQHTPPADPLAAGQRARLEALLHLAVRDGALAGCRPQPGTCLYQLRLPPRG
jgi:hypothetical protein